ncbi:MAG TPA: regulator SirB [Gammaproteobacteria bacterium]|jgi:uncharacterized membrane protein SirB2|nr:regulator SirB [Acidiferrobacteraceae bacterium]MDP6551703.1 SirB2 family protein [Arenicellales bacterium]MDP6792147.1 SirB2 family protein [Arenicellales bacterium]MDP6919709.1 SirB2 family protein [Arenicellales bacterium]HCX87819.1 regulator SirB [Gammaproteobacteria bacterium]|tara:strand:+ start:1055 stop:1438 length:384 start_codon:yes stop_codon:yes gene_type:complete
MDTYSLIKYIHTGCAALSVCGFVVRGVWALRDSPQLHHRLVRVLPHVVDAVLLASALLMLYLSSYRPSGSDWLSYKLAGVLLYIGFGMLALRRGRTRVQRAGAFAAALLVFAYVVAVAVTGQRWPLG